MQRNIRNFAIIAHIDHGKSTLSDRLLEATGTIAKNKIREQYLDKSDISRKRGITIKLAPVRMNYTLNAIRYTLNLIDTPGHVDFSYEVSRTLAACDGAVLLVDAAKGIQAQTVAHWQTAKKENLKFIPCINKIDLPNAQTQVVAEELVETFGFAKEEILLLSAKTGQGVEDLLKAIVKRFSKPQGVVEKPLRGLIFDAVYDEYRGVIAYVRIVDGVVKTGDDIQFASNKQKANILELGYFTPEYAPSTSLGAGEIGYIVTGIKDLREVRVGDTLLSAKVKEQNSYFFDEKGHPVEILPGFFVPKPMVFFGMYPKSTDDFGKLRESLGKLTLNDTAVVYTQEYSSYLGSGFRVGFLGLLHAEIVKERLKNEFGLDLFLTMPQVLYQKDASGNLLEPYMKLTVYTPSQYVGPVMSVCQNKKGVLLDLVYHQAYAVLSYEMPFSMFIRGLSADLKSVSAGFVSLDYEIGDFKEADLTQLEIRINETAVDVLSDLVYKEEAFQVAREKTEKLKEVLPRQQFRQVIQGVVDGTIAARSEIPPFRKDVLQKMSGGDRTRKDKLLEAQKKGKTKMKKVGKVNIPQEALFSLIDNT